MDFALGFDETYNQPENFENFKKAVRDRLAPLKTCHLNTYWTRSACGVSVLNEEGAASGKKKKKDKPTKKSKDIHHFSWNSIKASSVRLTAVAVRSAELAAMGVDADNAGFEKDGEEIMNLKVNGALALHFLCTENPYEHLTQLN
ncbi:unnamed protein product [Durusdinium trenchii]|uniref:Uncharacterized protein n=1 Tax=Durusdinium trenchii TaxID=1381693 RepID=A0ABP0HX52_9DINO